MNEHHSSSLQSYFARNRWSAYAVAIAATGGAVALFAAFFPGLELSHKLMLLLIPTLLSGYGFGTGPGISATVVAALGSACFVVSPAYSFAFDRPSHVVPWGLLVVIGIGASVFAGRRTPAGDQSLGEAFDRLEFRVSQIAAEQERAMRLLRTVTETAKIGLVILDEEHRYRYANAAYAQFLKLPTDRIVGERIAEVLPEVYETRIRSRLDAAFRGESVKYELRMPEEGGEERIYEVSYQLGPADTEKVVVIVVVEVTALKKSEEKLKASVQRITELRTALNEHAIVAMTDPQGRITEVNDKFCEISQYSREELIGQDHRIINSGAHSKEFIRDLWHTIGSGRVWQGDIKNRAKDGSFYWVATTIVPFLNEHGKPRQYIAIRADITARKLAEEARARLSGIVRSSDDAIIGQSLQGIITSWNAGAHKIFGYTGVEAVGKTMQMLIPPGREHEEPAILEQVAHNQSVNNLETKRVRKDGAEIDVSVTISPVEDSEGRVVGASYIARDITARKQAEEQLLFHEAVLRETGHIAKVGGWIFDVDTGDGFWTDEVAHIHELEPTERISKDVGLAFYRGEHRDRVEEAMRQAVHHGVPYDLEVELTTAKGNHKWIRTIGHPIVEDGRVVQVRGSFQDITEQRRAAEALRVSENQLRLFVEQAPACIAIFNREMSYLAASQRWVQSYGGGHKHLVGLNHYHVQPDMPARWREVHRRGLAGELQESEEDLWVREDGSESWLRWAVHPWRHGTGEIGGIIILAEDITARKRTEAMLEARRDQAQALLRLSQKLERAVSFSDALQAAQEEVERTLGFKTIWFSLLSEDRSHFRRIVTRNRLGPLPMPPGGDRFEIAGNPMLEEVVKGEGIVVVEDARTDPRTPKDVVAQLDNRTIVSMAISMADHKTGAIGTGTFGDEGTRTLNALEKEFFSAMASDVAAVLDRVMAFEERKKAEQRLGEERNLLRTLIDSMPDVIFTKDLEGRFGISNQAHLQLVGAKSEAELAGRSVFDLYPPELARAYHEDDQRVLQSGEPIFNRDEPCLNAKGDERWHLTIKVPLRNQARELIGLVGMSRDVTQRKAEEQARERQRRRTALLAEVSRRLVMSDSPQDALEDIFSNVAEELGVEYFFSYMVEGGDRLRLQVQGGLPKDLAEKFSELRFGQSLCGWVADQRERLVMGDLNLSNWPYAAEARALGITAFAGYPLLSAGRVIGTLAFATALRPEFEDEEVRLMGAVANQVATALERIRLMEELSRSEARFREMAESLPQLAWTCGPDGQCDYLSKQWLEYTGRPEAEQLGLGWAEALHPDDREDALAKWREALATESVYDLEFRLRRKDDEYRWFKTKAVPFRAPSGRVSKWFGSSADVESLKQAEESLRDREQQLKNVLDRLEVLVEQRTEELRAANKELESFSYSVSHDLRAPLRAVDGFSQAVLEDFGSQLPEEGHRYLKTIREGAQRMGMLIDDLLTFSRLSRAELVKRDVDNDLLVQTVLDELQHEIAGRQVEYKIGRLPNCFGDPALLKQVWINLISNALKYSRKREQAIIEIGCDRDPNGDAYFVRDNGSGFDMRYAHKLFGVFQRLHRMEDFEGTGVGLAIVQRVIHRHGGRIWANAAVDAGATFCFTVEGGPNHE